MPALPWHLSNHSKKPALQKNDPNLAVEKRDVAGVAHHGKRGGEEKR